MRVEPLATTVEAMDNTHNAWARRKVTALIRRLQRLIVAGVIL